MLVWISVSMSSHVQCTLWLVYLAVSTYWWFFLVGVLLMRALLFGVCLRAPEFWMLPMGHELQGSRAWFTGLPIVFGSFKHVTLSPCMAMQYCSLEAVVQLNSEIAVPSRLAQRVHVGIWYAL